MLAALLLSPSAAQDGAAEPGKSTIDATFWGALVFASKGETKKPVPEPVAGRLGKAFKNYSGFDLLGQHTQGVVFRDYENWIVPSDEINLELESKGPADGGGMKVLLKLWQKQKVLVKMDVVVKPGLPVFIAGPEWRDGRLIFVLELKG
jgi:hypothetical protein